MFGFGKAESDSASDTELIGGGQVRWRLATSPEAPAEDKKSSDARRQELKDKRLAAAERAKGYKPPVRVVEYEAGMFLEAEGDLGTKLSVPRNFIESVTATDVENYEIQYVGGAGWFLAKGIAHIVVRTHSGAEHSLKIEWTCADALLDAMLRAWRGQKICDVLAV